MKVGDLVIYSGNTWKIETLFYKAPEIVELSNPECAWDFIMVNVSEVSFKPITDNTYYRAEK